MSLVEVEDVWYRYPGGERPVVQDVELSLGRGDVVAVVGESGCGKTTVGKLVAGLLRPVSGRLRFEGEDVNALRGARKSDWRRAVQMVHQDPYASLNPSVTVGSALRFGPRHFGVVDRGDVEDMLLGLLDDVGLEATEGFLRRYPHELSGGQRQRVAIARAVSVNPRVIVADEVTSMLDVSMRVAILDLLLAFQKTRGLSYLFISHDFGVVRYFAKGGRVVVMFYGVVVEDGRTDDVIYGPLHPYTRMLLDSIPVPDPLAARSRKRLPIVQGSTRAAGCVFSGRCWFAEDRCRDEKPVLVERRSGHRVACFFPERTESLGQVDAEVSR